MGTVITHALPASTETPKATMATLAPPGNSANDNIRRFTAPSRPRSPPAEHTLFHPKTRAFIYGLQPRACQGMPFELQANMALSNYIQKLIESRNAGFRLHL